MCRLPGSTRLLIRLLREGGACGRHETGQILVTFDRAAFEQAGRCVIVPTKNPGAARGRMPGQIAPAYVAVDANTVFTGAGAGWFGGPLVCRGAVYSPLCARRVWM